MFFKLYKLYQIEQSATSIYLEEESLAFFSAFCNAWILIKFYFHKKSSALVFIKLFRDTPKECFVRNSKMAWTIWEALPRRCSVKNMFFKNSAKFTGKHLCQSLFFNNRCFPVNFAKVLRTLLRKFFCRTPPSNNFWIYSLCCEWMKE